MTTQSDTQKELREILKDLFCFDCPQQWCRVPEEDTCKRIEKSERQILDLFKKMARECVGQTSVASYKSVYPTWADGFKECSNRTHKNIEEKFR